MKKKIKLTLYIKMNQNFFKNKKNYKFYFYINISNISKNFFLFFEYHRYYELENYVIIVSRYNGLINI